jgi:dolichol-phosphate mannosyltransferase
MSFCSPRVSIIIPTKNESENIDWLIARIIASAVQFEEIVFVDNQSTDGTRTVIRAHAKTLPIRIVTQSAARPGLAGAIMLGAEAAKGDLLIVMDADLSHPPEGIIDLLAPLLAGEADMTIASRYIKGGSAPGWPLCRRILSRAGSLLAYPLTGVHDSMCGFFAIWRCLLLQVDPPSSGFKIAFETIVRAGPTLRTCEIPFVFRDRVRGQSKMSFTIAARYFGRWLAAVLWRCSVRFLVPVRLPEPEKFELRAGHPAANRSNETGVAQA